MANSEPYEMAMDLLKNSEVSSGVVQALREAVDVLASTGRSKPASSLSEVENGSRKFKPSSSKRQQLTAEEAAEIYKMRPKVESKGKRPKRGSMIRCKSIAPKFGVSAKTIRDIWRGRTWIEATRHLWTSEEKQRRAIHGEDQSDSDVEDQPKQSELMSIANIHPINNQFLQEHRSLRAATQAPNHLQQLFGPAPWISGNVSWPTNQMQPFGHQAIPCHQTSGSSALSPQLLQQKISMLEMALNTLKSSPTHSQPTLSQPMLPSPFSAMGCPPFQPNLTMNPFVRNGLNGASYQTPQPFSPLI